MKEAYKNENAYNNNEKKRNNRNVPLYFVIKPIIGYYDIMGILIRSNIELKFKFEEIK